MIRNSLLYQAIICFILINLIIPSWCYIIKTIFKKNKKDKIPIATTDIDTSSPITVDPETQNLVYEPNGNTHGSV